MKSKVLLFGLMVFGALSLSSCSGEETTDTPTDEATVEAVSEEVAAELNEVQDVNEEVNELDQEVSAFLDSLNN